jgi:hypothetical protein
MGWIQKTWSFWIDLPSKIIKQGLIHGKIRGDPANMGIYLPRNVWTCDIGRFLKIRGFNRLTLNLTDHNRIINPWIGGCPSMTAVRG